MKEIKFRLWNGSAMEPVGSITFHTDGSYHVNDEYPVNDIVMETRFGGNRYYLMQFTGLKDKNDKDIYEGDIVCEYGNSLAVVEWVDRGIYMVGFGATRFRAADQRVIDTADVKSLAQQMARSEVIGNIYENPELLGG